MLDSMISMSGFGALMGAFTWLASRQRLRAMERVEDPSALTVLRDSELRTMRTARRDIIGCFGALVILAVIGWWRSN